MRRMAFISAMAFLFIAASASHAATVYVRAGAPGTGTISEPLASIQQALDAASDGDTINVAAGTYTENLYFSGKLLTIQGGWDATFAERDRNVHVTIIDGNQAGCCVTYGYGAGGELSGFTITNGKRDGNGGGIIAANNLVIRNNTITRNEAACGGGVFASSGHSLTITGNTITGNISGGCGAGCGAGGGIYCHSGTISDNLIIGNIAPFGAGIFAADATITGNIIVDNEASGYGGGVSCFGSAVITGNTISDNSANLGAGVYFEGTGQVIISGNTISNNSAFPAKWSSYFVGGCGGGIFCGGPSATITGNTITGNTAHPEYTYPSGGYGGGIYCYSGSSATEGYIIIGNTISRNTAYKAGGGLRCEGSAPIMIAGNMITANVAANGTGIHCSGASPAISGNTLAGNRAYPPYEDTAVCCFSPPSTIITNCVLWNYGVELTGGSATYSCIRGGLEGEGNISSYPHLVDPFNGDYRLRSYSPCINAGSNATVVGEVDIDGEARIMLGTVDIGADESAVQSADSDDDGLPDDWEMDCFGHLDYDADDDPHGSGLTNMEYYLTRAVFGLAQPAIYVSAANAGDPLADGTQERPLACIQQAIELATVRVIVAEGTYAENIVVNAKSLNIEGGWAADFSERDSARFHTIIDGGGQGTTVSYANVSGGSLSGFTITSGCFYNGGGIYCHSSSPVISGNTITGNRASDGGGGIYCYSSSPAINGNTISGNVASSGGGGIYCATSSAAVITNNMIIGNSANQGAGIGCLKSVPVIRNNTICGNKAFDIGSGIYSNLPSLPVVNCILWNHSSEFFRCTVTFSCVRNGSGADNITSYPHFVDPDNGNYRLRPYSPCINVGSNAAAGGDVDIDGQPRILLGTVDMGAHESTVHSMDTDGDGLPDDWEEGYLGGIECGPDEDTDGDGLTNLEEYLAGTDPSFDNSVIYVNVLNAGDPLANGSLEHPLPRIQQAIPLASARVAVAQGRYIENVFIDIKSVHIEGGWASDFSERDPARYPTVIDGSGAGNVLVYMLVKGGSISGFTITNGKAATGGGIYCSGTSSPAITNNTITGNTATVDGGGIAGGKSLAITGNRIIGNSCGSYGGGFVSATVATVTGNTITGNTAAYGGAIVCGGASAIIGNTINGNIAQQGAGIYCLANSQPSIRSNIITGNRASSYGGGIYCGSSTPAIDANTISGNRASLRGGGVYCDAATVTISNTILWGDTASTGREIYLTSSTKLNIYYNAVMGGQAGLFVESGCTVNWTLGNIEGDPLFAAPGFWDGRGTVTTSDDIWHPGDYHLKSQFGRWNPAANAGAGGWVYDSITSPCIDAGRHSGSYANEPRPNGRRLNMGAYGNTAQASKSAKWTMPGDTNDDCKINVLDLIFIRNNLNASPDSGGNWKADVNEDGKINVLDLIMVRNRLNTLCD